MKQFNLGEWLQDKNRKVMTRRGNPVRIICTDRKHGEDDLPIVFLEQCHNGEFLLTCRKDGRCDTYDTQYDLFFADEEDELTEFEKRFIELIRFWMSGNTNPEENLIQSRFDAKELLDLARKELEKNIEDGAIEFAKSYMEDVNPSFEKVQESEELWKWKMSCLRGINKAYTQGKQDALKDLPKWKKVPLHEKIMYGMSEISDVYYNGYFIHLDDIYKALPKEE